MAARVKGELAALRADEVLINVEEGNWA